MPRKTLSKLLLILISFLFSGCATLIHGSSQEMFLTCEPRVAAVFVDGNYLGKTPMNARLARGKNHLLKIELTGYKPFEATLTRRLDGWIFGNILLGGIIGIAVDAASGSMYRLSPKDIYPELTPLAANDSTGTKALSIRIVLHPDPAWEKVGQLTALMPDIARIKIGQL